MNFSRDFTRSNDLPESGHLAVTRLLHDDLLAVLTDAFGSDLTVDEVCDSEHGLVSYRFQIAGAECTAGLYPWTDGAAVLSFNALLGRIWHRYPAALRWLAENRSHNTVALAYREESARNGDLLIASNRVTLIGDTPGIHATLVDFCLETRKTMYGLKLWFPQLLVAEELLFLENGEEGETSEIDCSLSAPNLALEAIEAAMEGIEHFAIPYSYLTRWTGNWEKNIRILNTLELRADARKNKAQKGVWAGDRLCALMQLKRYREAMAEALPAMDTEVMSAAVLAALRAECLCHLGEDEEALTSLQSAEFDGEPRVELVRSLAAVKLGRKHEASISYTAYERLIGHDRLARRMLNAFSKGDSEED